MKPFSFHNLMLAGLAVLLAAGCASKPKTTTSDAVAGADSSVVSDRDSKTDPLGSDSGRIEGLNTIYFEYDQARLTSEARQILSQNAEWIKNNANFTVQIEGHTDDRGSNEYNLSLGERRAKSVKTYLEGLGIDPRRMSIISYGEEKPKASGDGEGTWSQNRRANFVPLQ